MSTSGNLLNSFILLLRERTMYVYKIRREIKLSELKNQIYHRPRQYDKESLRLIGENKLQSLFQMVHWAIETIVVQYLGLTVGDIYYEFLEKRIEINFLGARRDVFVMYSFLGLSLGIKKERLINIKYEIIEDAPTQYKLDYDPPYIHQLKNILNEIKQSTAKIIQEDDKSIMKLVEEIENFSIKPVKIAVIGRPSSGKSTFLNAILGRNILPQSIDTCTGTLIEISHNTSTKGEHIQIELISESDYELIIKQLQADIDNLSSEIDALSDSEIVHTHANELQSKSILRRENENFLQQVMSEYDKLVKTSEGSNVILKFPDKQMKITIQSLLDQTAVNISHASSTVIHKVRVFLNIENKILHHITFVDTPGRGENSLRDNRIVQALQYVDGWIYLTKFDAHGTFIEEDLKTLHSYARKSYGVVAITQFDINIHDIKSVNIDQLLFEKRAELQKICYNQVFPAVASRVVLEATKVCSYAVAPPARGAPRNRKNTKFPRAKQDLYVKLNPLSKLHVGEFFFHLAKRTDEDEEEEEEEDDSNDELNNESDDEEDSEDDFATNLQLRSETNNLSLGDFELSNNLRDKKHLLYDFALESSLFIPMLAELYKTIEEYLVVNEINILISQMRLFIYNQMVSCNKLLQSAQDDLSDSAITVEDYLLTQDRHLANRIFSLEKSIEDLIASCVRRENQLSEEIHKRQVTLTNQFVEEYETKMLYEQTQRNVLALMKKRVLTVQLNDLNELIICMVRDCIKYKISNHIISECFRDEFFFRHQILVKLEVLAEKIKIKPRKLKTIVTLQQKQRGNSSFKQALTDLIQQVRLASEANTKIISEDGLVSLKEIHKTIIKMSSDYLTQLKRQQGQLQEQIISRQRGFHSIPKPPGFLFHVREKLFRDYYQLNSLALSTFELLLCNQIREQNCRGASTLRNRTKLSKREERYLEQISEMFLTGNEPNDSSLRRDEISLLNPTITTDIVIHYLNKSLCYLSQSNADQPPIELAETSLKDVINKKIRAIFILNDRLVVIHCTDTTKSVRWKEMSITPNLIVCCSSQRDSEYLLKLYNSSVNLVLCEKIHIQSSAAMMNTSGTNI